MIRRGFSFRRRRGRSMIAETMTRRLAFLPLMALAASCQPAEDAGAAAAPQASPAPAPAATLPVPPPDIIASAEGLIGEYRVAGVDGADIDLPHAITASIAEDRIDLTSDCIRLAWSYRFESGALATEREPVPSCRRALLLEEEAVAAAFDVAGVVRRTPANGLEFAGRERSVTLFGQ